MALFSRKLLKNIRNSYSLYNRNYINPFTRTWDIISTEIKSGLKKKQDVNVKHADVVIIGGGFIGSSAAYWLKTKAGESLSVIVLDKDLTNKKYENLYSHGVLSQHFTQLENIYLSQYSAEFYRNIKEHLDEGVDLQFCPHGYLSLASEEYAHKLENNVLVQKECGVINKLLSVEEIQDKYSWINTSGIKLGCISTETEGIFNSIALLNGFVNKSKQMSTIYIKGEVIGFDMELQRDVLMEGVAPGKFKKTNCLTYRTDDNEEHKLKFAVCVLAAGAETRDVARLAKIGCDDGLLKFELPVEKRDYNVYSVEEPENKMSFGLNAPFIMDTSGLWLRRNGLDNNVICGLVPALLKDDNVLDKDVFKASLLTRYPQFQNSKVKVISTETIDCNTYDESGILGPHVYHNNLIFATGFGRQGVHHSPGIGRAVSELIIDSQYTTIDLTRFGFDRLLMDEPLIEFNVFIYLYLFHFESLSVITCVRQNGSVRRAYFDTRFIVISPSVKALSNLMLKL